jgi:hypothetical protein
MNPESPCPPDRGRLTPSQLTERIGSEMKSSRHAKICGDFGESLVLYWLSKHGFECAAVDHTGIDIIARNKISGHLMGISVKSRTRIEGTEFSTVDVPAHHFPKIETACKEFGCSPHIAIVVDAHPLIRAYLMPLSRFLELCPTKKNSYWKMNIESIKAYENDAQIMAFELNCMKTRGW